MRCFETKNRRFNLGARIPSGSFVIFFKKFLKYQMYVKKRMSRGTPNFYMEKKTLHQTILQCCFITEEKNVNAKKNLIS